jgi:hypothetical protein
MELKTKIMALPAVCGLGDAERWSAILGMLWDLEAQGNSVFDKNENDIKNPGERMRTGYAWTFFDLNPKRGEYIRKLLDFAELYHRCYRHGEIELTDDVQSLEDELTEAQTDFPEVEAVLSVEDVTVATGWNG